MWKTIEIFIYLLKTLTIFVIKKGRAVLWPNFTNVQISFFFLRNWHWIKFQFFILLENFPKLFVALVIHKFIIHTICGFNGNYRNVFSFILNQNDNSKSASVSLLSYFVSSISRPVSPYSFHIYWHYRSHSQAIQCCIDNAQIQSIPLEFFHSVRSPCYKHAAQLLYIRSFLNPRKVWTLVFDFDLHCNTHLSNKLDFSHPLIV